MSEENIFEDGLVTPVEETADESEVSVEEKVAPRYGSAEWSDYVLEHLVEDEVENGQPTVDAMRRVTELLVGPIINMETEVVQPPMESNQWRSTVVMHITVRNNLIGETVRVSGAADAYGQNILSKKFNMFPVAIAETRAEGRCYKRILKLMNHVSAEETLGADSDEIIDFVEGNINESQVDVLDKQCKKLDINVKKFVTQQVGELNNISEISYEDASQKLFSPLSAYRSSKVPEELTGYDPNWKSEF